MLLTSGALLLTLGSSLGWGAFDALRKQLARHVQPLPLAALLSLGQLPLFAAWAWLAPPRHGLAWGAYLPEALGSVTFNLVGNLLFLRAVQVSPLSLTIPFLSFSPVFSALLAFALLGETPSGRQLSGVALVVLGALLLNLPREDLARPRCLLRGLARERGSLLMLGTAAVWALGAVFDKRALRHAPASLHALVLSGLMSTALLTLLGARRELRALGRVTRCRGAFAGALGAACAAQALQLLALPRLLVSLFEALKRCVGMSLAVVNGALFFGERVTGQKVSAIVLMGAGVVLLVV